MEGSETRIFFRPHTEGTEFFRTQRRAGAREEGTERAETQRRADARRGGTERARRRRGEGAEEAERAEVG